MRDATRRTLTGRAPGSGARAGAIALLTLGLAGCGGKPKNFENDNDALRRRVAELERERDLLQARAAEAEGKLAETARAMGATPEGQVLEALPRTAGIEIDRFTGFTDADGDGLLDSADVYIRPFDGRRRFVQVAGTVTVELVVVPAKVEAPAGTKKSGATKEPALKDGATAPAEAAGFRVGPVVLAPRELREAYRSSLMGTHYLAHIPIPAEAGELAEVSMVVRVELADPVAGTVHKAERLVTR